MNNVGLELRTIASRLTRIAAELGGEDVWDRDVSAELARNDNCPSPLENGWWQRCLGQIDGVTIHHTLSHSPHQTAAYYVTKGGGRPSIPYHFWITETGEVLLCLALTEGCWHDHTGHRNTHVSVGLAGRLHERRPTEVQLGAAVRVTRWLVHHPGMRVTRERVKGHCDYARTVCPGWNAVGWQQDFYEMLDRW